MTEREIKLSFPTRVDARAAVIAAGAAPLHPGRLQDDTLFDTADQALRHRGCVLRLRMEENRALLTFKGPATVATGMKVREEHETPVGDGGVLRLVLEQLGLRAWFRYQKHREEFTAPDVTIAVDDTPVGTFIEIEGSESAVIANARALGRTPDDFITDSYYRLFLTRRAQYGLSGDHMLFENR